MGKRKTETNSLKEKMEEEEQETIMNDGRFLKWKSLQLCDSHLLYILLIYFSFSACQSTMQCSHNQHVNVINIFDMFVGSLSLYVFLTKRKYK